jgi:hypothetical protein
MMTTTTAVLPNDINGVAVEVTGEIIGQGTSDDGLRLRWNEVDIWRTRNGYVVHKRGLSSVYHKHPGGCGFGRIVLLRSLDDDNGESVPCPICSPPEEDRNGTISVRMEKIRSSVHICSTPDGVVESLHSIDPQGVRFMNRVAAHALRAAISVDPSLGTAKIVVS